MCASEALQAVAGWVNDELAKVGISFRKDYYLQRQMVLF